MARKKTVVNFGVTHPRDGYHVVQNNEAGVLGLYAEIYGNGELQNLSESGLPYDATRTLVEWDDQSPRNLGACLRLHYLMIAVTRYLNTGGTMDLFREALREFETIAKDGIFFGDWYLVDSYVCEDGGFVHIFHNDSDDKDAVRWIEPTYTPSGGVIGGFLERMTREQLRREYEEVNGDPDPAA